MGAGPATPSAFLKALRDEGLTVVEVGNWRNHNRNSKGSWGPVHGVLIHHTVTRGSANTVSICRTGYSSLPGPLCHGVITKDGRVHLVGYGRANHAGGGDPRVLAAVKDEDYGSRPPAPARGNSDGTDGNRYFYGFECENMGDGKDPWPAAQLLAIEKAGAALCKLHGWNEKSVIGHAEWSNDKIDPRGFTMPSMRTRIKNRLAKKPTAKYHTVVDGDTLWKISQKYDVAVDVLRRLNPKIKDDIIVPGDPGTGRVRYK